MKSEGKRIIGTICGAFGALGSVHFYLLDDSFLTLFYLTSGAVLYSLFERI